MLILFVKFNGIGTRFALIWDSFVVKFGVFEALLVNSARMLAFESLLGVFWTTFGAQNGALGLVVDHIWLTLVPIWSLKVDKIVKKYRKVSIEIRTGNISLQKYNSGPSQTSKSGVSSTRNACFQQSHVS